MTHKFLILAHPRSGTMYTTECLRAVGLDVGHEVPGGDGAVSFVWGGPGEPALEHGLVILHQTRHPLRVIGSMHGEPLRIWHQLWYQIQDGFPEPIPSTSLIGPAHENETVWAALTWLRLNRYIAGEAPVMTYRVEDIESKWPEILDRIGVPHARFPANIPKNTNTRRGVEKPVITWDMLRRGLPDALYHDVQYAAEVYGYSITDDETVV